MGSAINSTHCLTTNKKRVAIVLKSSELCSGCFRVPKRCSKLDCTVKCVQKYRWKLQMSEFSKNISNFLRILAIYQNRHYNDTNWEDMLYLGTTLSGWVLKTEPNAMQYWNYRILKHVFFANLFFFKEIPIFPKFWVLLVLVRNTNRGEWPRAVKWGLERRRGWGDLFKNSRFTHVPHRCVQQVLFEHTVQVSFGHNSKDSFPL